MGFIFTPSNFSLELWARLCPKHRCVVEKQTSKGLADIPLVGLHSVCHLEGTKVQCLHALYLVVISVRFCFVSVHHRQHEAKTCSTSRRWRSRTAEQGNVAVTVRSGSSQGVCWPPAQLSGDGWKACFCPLRVISPSNGCP